MMSWRQEYLENLKQRDELEKANYDLIDACEAPWSPKLSEGN